MPEPEKPSLDRSDRARATRPNFDALEERLEEEDMEQETRILEPVPAEDEIRITATPWLDEV